MKPIKILFRILIFVMLVGGIMGLMKGLLPNMSFLSFRFLSGMGSAHGSEKIPTYALIYGIVLATLEITASVLLLSKRRIGFSVTIATLTVSAIGCTFAIFLGDLFSIFSLLVRCIGLYVTIKVKGFNSY